MKNKICNFLVWILNKWLSPEFDKCQFGTTITIGLKHYIPNDNEWHHCALTTGYWIKLPKEGIMKENLYIDGVRVRKVLKELKGQ